MRFSLLSIAAGACLLANFVVVVNGFSVPASSTSPRSFCRLSADASSDAGPTRTKPMSPEEIKARMGLPDEDEEPPKLFSESLYEDMRQTLLTLEKRVKEGPGSLSMLDAEEMSAQTQRILSEMREFEAGRVSGLGNAQPPAGIAAAAAAAPKQPTATEMEVMKSKEAIETSEDEGPVYDGKGGMGMAKGTRNTYILPGMDEMTPEEYQAALNQSILSRQKERQASGGYGNRATWDYLNNLTGEKGVLKKDVDNEQP